MASNVEDLFNDGRYSDATAAMGKVLVRGQRDSVVRCRLALWEHMWASAGNKLYAKK